MKKLTLLALLLFCSPGSHAQGNPPVFRCKDQRHIIKVSLNVSGQSVEGPACAEITINALRYNADFGKTVSYTGGVNLPAFSPLLFPRAVLRQLRLRVWRRNSTPTIEYLLTAQTN